MVVRHAATVVAAHHALGLGVAFDPPVDPGRTGVAGVLQQLPHEHPGITAVPLRLAMGPGCEGGGVDAHRASVSRANHLGVDVG